MEFDALTQSAVIDAVWRDWYAFELRARFS
jgi:hypothetical protein